MNPRQRFIQTLSFGTPDRIPFQPGYPRESTRARWHTEGLPENADSSAHLIEVLGIEPEQGTKPGVSLNVSGIMIPQFEEKVLEHKNGHYICQDWKGNICEISDKFDVTYLRSPIDFVTRRWIRCPVQNRDDWEQMKLRYQLDTPGRFPDDFAERCRMAKESDWPVSVHFSGPFWQMREWCGLEGLCFLIVDQPDLVADMAAFWTDFVSKILERILQSVTPDIFWISEDMAYKAKAMISPAMVRWICMPSWVRWTKQAMDAGVPLVDVDSDGFIGELIPLWIESGVNVCDPVEVAAHNDIVDFRRQFGSQISFRGGIDKRAIAKGGQTIRDEHKRIEPVIKGGGFIPSCDHGVPSDISWPNFVDYARLLAQMTGWL